MSAWLLVCEYFFVLTGSKSNTKRRKSFESVPVGQMGPLDRMTGMSPNGRPSSEPVQKSGRVQSISDCENGWVYLRYIYCISTD